MSPTAPDYSYILVESTSHALRLEKWLSSGRITSRLVPVPRQLSSDCGVCVRIETAFEAQAAEWILQGGLKTQGIYRLP